MKSRTTALALAGLALGASLTGCKVSGTRTNPGGSGATPGAGAAPGDGGGAAQGAGGGRGTGTGALARCRTEDLSARLGRLDGAAGARSSAIVLTNTSGRACRIYGYPGVGIAVADGSALPSSDQRVGGPPPHLVLKPSGSAYAEIDWAAPGGADPQSQSEAALPGLLTVIPPDETRALRVPWSFGQVAEQGNFRVSPLEPGTGPA
ncbi:lipoprotein [Actinomadura verrucosospora]|uniref:Lipoprotein n=2 Tax=Actinomadura verrucosospora TaxID=46165 RepID=A0A7D4AI57_ACTVE|nr:lipoprotein [Actinomadura verrucosospora]